MLLPEPRGPVSSAIVEAILRQDPSLLLSLTHAQIVDPVGDEDLQIALWTCYELHYQGFDGCEPTWERQPELIATRRTLEAGLLRAVESHLAQRSTA